MRGTFAALLGVGLLLAASAAQAQTSSPNPCGMPARAPARATLAQATMFSPWGYGPFGWAPLLAPWGPDPWDTAALFAPPGTLAAYGPLGPGLTANNIASAARANGINLSPSQQVDFASQQQTELGTLYHRFTLGAQLQLASATWALSLPARASAARSILPRLCRSQQARATAEAPSNTPSEAPSNAPSEAPAGAQP
jgi:hypothetical protein